MTGAGGVTLWLVVCAVTTLLTAGQASRRPAVCDIWCCYAFRGTIRSSCTDATDITCDCPPTYEMVLHRASFPDSVERISISGVRIVTINDSAISDLPRLVNFAIRNVNILEIRQNGLAMPADGRLRSLRIFNVQNATILGSAFSGSWHNNIKILMQHITTLSVEQNAFNYHSTSLGPSLALYDVTVLDLASSAFTAPISRLSMSYVHMNSCRHGSFGGSIHRLLLDHMKISAAEGGCVNGGSDGMAELSMLSCFLISVQPYAFSGNIDKVVINGTNIRTVGENGFQIQAVDLQIKASYIDVLESNGLTVSAKNSILLNNVRVGMLQKHALIGLKVDQSTDGDVQPLVIRTLRIDNAENVSLAFAECMPVSLDGLNVTRPRPQVCPTAMWTQQLVGSSAADQLTQAKYQVYQQLVRGNPCIGDEYDPPPTTGVDSRCTDAFDTPQGAGATDTPQGAGGANTPQGARATDTHQGAGATDTPQGPRVTDTPYRARATDTPHGAGATDTPQGADEADSRSQLVLYCVVGALSVLTVVLIGMLIRRRRARSIPTGNTPTHRTESYHQYEEIGEGRIESPTANSPANEHSGGLQADEDAGYVDADAADRAATNDGAAAHDGVGDDGYMEMHALRLHCPALQGSVRTQLQGDYQNWPRPASLTDAGVHGPVYANVVAKIN